MTAEFAQVLGNHMYTNDLSQSELARQAGVNKSTVSRLMKGNMNAGPAIAVRLAEALHIPGEDRSSSRQGTTPL